MLPSLNLDDLTYQQIVEILRAHLPGEQWSDHNPSDPGVTLLELLSWLGEMDLYRMNRVPAVHQEKFLKLLVDPPVPVSVIVSLRLQPLPPPPPPAVPPRADVVIPAGLRVASDYRLGRRTVLESFTSTTLTHPAYAADLSMRAVHDLVEIPLGVSDGSANQTFAIPEGPVLLDFGSAVPTYDPNPNPRVRVGATEWELHPFLLTPASQASPSPPPHFMIDAFENRVRFGDGVFGAIPPATTPITLIRCQILEGPAALIAEGDVQHILNPEIIHGLAAGESVVLAGNSDAQGGENFFSAGERVRRGLAEFRNPTRLITAADFQRVATNDYNAFQVQFNVAVGRDLKRDLVTRAMALMNRRPPNLSIMAAGHVTLVILPAYDQAAFDAAPFSAPSPTVSKVSLAAPSPRLTKRLLAFLDQRRLITTRVEVAAPTLVKIALRVAVVVESQRNTTQIEQAVRAALHGYLSITSGYDDGRGWPLGRRVRRSQLYRVLEDIPGVDYVESLTLLPANADGDIALGPLELPAFDGDVLSPSSTALAVQVVRKA